jgi:hypothetical protein
MPDAMRVCTARMDSQAIPVATSVDATGGLKMDKATIELLARRAGLDKALAQFPEDVAAAATQAANVVEKIKQPTDPAAEPWPPMRAGSGL